MYVCMYIYIYIYIYIYRGGYREAMGGTGGFPLMIYAIS